MFLHSDDSEKLRTILGYTFKNEQLLQQALTRKSAVAEKRQEAHVGHNERLEFFGDSLVRTVVDDMLMEQCPKAGEGELSYKRDKWVSKSGFLYKAAERMGIGDFIMMGKGEEENFRGKGKRKILVDVMEAMIGAIFIDCGKDYHYIRQFIQFCIYPEKRLALDQDTSLESTDRHRRATDFSKDEKKLVKVPPHMDTMESTKTLQLPEKKYVSNLNQQLLDAVIKDDLETVLQLLTRGANPNTLHAVSYPISCPFGLHPEGFGAWTEICAYSKHSTALDAAIRRFPHGQSPGFTQNTVKIVAALLKHKANPNLMSHFSHPLLHETIIYYPKREDNPKKYFLSICHLLCQHGADLNLRVKNLGGHGDGFTPLELAVIFQDYKKIEVLLKAGADSTLRNAKGRTLLHTVALYAELHQEREREKEKSWSTHRHFRYVKQDDMPLYRAIASLLLKSGVDPTVTDTQGLSAADLTNDETLKELLSPTISEDEQVNEEVDKEEAQDSTSGYVHDKYVSRTPPKDPEESVCVLQ